MGGIYGTYGDKAKCIQDFGEESWWKDTFLSPRRRYYNES